MLGKIFKHKVNTKGVDLLTTAQDLNKDYNSRIVQRGQEYLDNFDEVILKAAAQGEDHVISFRFDEFKEDWQTYALLMKMKEKYEAKGFYVKVVHPYNSYPDTWLRIYWGGDEYEAAKNPRIESVNQE